jgi:hypothetical protein
MYRPQLLCFVQAVLGARQRYRFVALCVGTFSGAVFGNHQIALGFGFRLCAAINQKSGKEMSAQEFENKKKKTLLGVSLTVITPTGQYNPIHLVNWGIHRWAFKPELGYSRRWGNWLLDGYAGVWFYTTNNAFFSMPNPQPQTEQPIGSFEGHLSYDFTKKRCWVSVDGNFWY